MLEEMMRPGSCAVPLTGVTRNRAELVLPPFQELFNQVGLLKSQVDRARVLRNDLPRLGRDAKLAEISALLTEVKLPPVAVPLEKRGLLTAAELSETVTPMRLFQAMVAAFDAANQFVHEIKTLWDNNATRFQALEAALQELRALAVELGAVSTQELTVAESGLAAVRTRVVADPLGATADLDREVQPLIDSCRQRLTAVKGLRDQVRHDLDEAEHLLTLLRSTHAGALEAARERKEKCLVEHEDQLTMPFDASVVEQLAGWLGQLKTMVSAGKFQAAATGLSNWSSSARTRMSSADAALKANAALVQERRDLRGTLEALKVKAQADGLAEDAELAKIFEAAQILYRRPTAMAQARALVQQYQTRVFKG